MTATQQKTVRRKAVKATPTHAGELSSLPIHRSMGNGALSEYLFSKYKVSDPSDSAEIAAERAADKVMAGGKVDAGAPAGGEQTVFRSEEGGSAPEPGGSGSTGLPGPVQEKMEGAFGRSLGGVRVHHDERADALSRGFHAKAFTQGSDIYFRKGAYNPGSKKGQRLIAHEVAHVDEDGEHHIHRTVEEENNFTALCEDDTVFLDFYNAIKNDCNFLKQVEEDETYKAAAAAANAAAGSGGVGGAMARIGYGKDTATKWAGGAEMLGALTTETGSVFGTISAGVVDKSVSNKYKSNAKAITAAGQGMNVIADVINFGANASKSGKAKEALKDINQPQNISSHNKEKAKKSILLARDKIEEVDLTPDEKNKRKISLGEISGKFLYNKLEEAQELMIKFIKDYEDETVMKTCTDYVKSARRAIGMSFGLDNKSLSEERRTFLNDQKFFSSAGMGKSIGMMLGHGMSGIGAALESFALSGGAVNSKFAIIGGIMSAAGGIVSSITSAFSNVTKAKREAEAKGNAEKGEEYAQGLLVNFKTALADRNYDFDPSSENGKTNRQTIYQTYFKWKVDGIGIKEFTKCYKNKDSGAAKKVVMDCYK